MPKSDGKQEVEEQNRLVQFQALLDAISETSLTMSLFHSFIKVLMTEWEILNGDFDSAAHDPLFCWAVDGNLSSLSAAIDADPELLQCRKAGFTLLHVAADYCHEHIVRGKTQLFVLILQFYTPPRNEQ